MVLDSIGLPKAPKSATPTMMPWRHECAVWQRTLCGRAPTRCRLTSPSALQRGSKIVAFLMFDLVVTQFREREEYLLLCQQLQKQCFLVQKPIKKHSMTYFVIRSFFSTDGEGTQILLCTSNTK